MATVFCCLKKIDKCMKRLQRNDKKTRIGGKLRQLFDEFVGESHTLFEDNEVVCSKHYAEIRNTDALFLLKQKRYVSQNLNIEPVLKDLRSGKEFEAPVLVPQLEHEEHTAELHESEAVSESVSEVLPESESESQLKALAEAESELVLQSVDL